MSDEIETEATRFWESRYGEREQIWSGNPNRALVDAIGPLDLMPGTALDLGSGEGGDSIWLAQQGWRVTGIDISATALARAAAHARERGLGADRITWQQADLAAWTPTGEFDLVSACFLHSPVAFPREEVLRRTAGAVAPGGYLLVVGHAAFPPWRRENPATATDAGEGHEAAHGHDHGHDHENAHGHDHDHDHEDAPDEHAHGHDDGDLPTPAEVLEALALPEGAWTTVIAENRSREATGPDGRHATLDDSVLLIRRA